MNLSTSGIGVNEEFCLDGVKYRLLDRVRGVFQKVGSSQCYILQEHENKSDDDLYELINQVISEYNRNCRRNIALNPRNDTSLNDGLKAVCDEIHKSKSWMNIILSECIIKTKSKIASLCPVPDNISEYKTISDIAYNEALSIRTKILALDNLTNMITTIYHSVPSKIKRIGANCIYVNPNDGNVIVILDRCLDINAYRSECSEDGLFLELSEKNGLTERMLVRFLAYTAFIVICRNNPYDVTAALKLYPLLTKPAARKINEGQMGFVFSTPNCDNPINSDNIEKVWKLLPSFFRASMCNELDNNSREDKHSSLKQWQIQIRMLRDSLIIVKNRPVLYDWDLQQNLLLLKCNEYLIPVWPRKAIYWYHVGLSYSDGENGIIGGIDADLRLKNNSNILWFSKKGIQISRGQSIKLEEGMIINVGSQTIKILAGKGLHGQNHRNIGIGSDVISVNESLIGDDIRYILEDGMRKRNE